MLGSWYVRINGSSSEVYTSSIAHVRATYLPLRRFTTLHCRRETSSTATRNCSCTGILQAPQVLYTPRTTATSCMSAPRPATYHETTHSFTAPHSALLLPEDKTRSHRPSLKRVQFPDDVPQSRQTCEGSVSLAYNAWVLKLCDAAANSYHSKWMCVTPPRWVNLITIGTRL
jgi:hypothetical protein